MELDDNGFLGRSVEKWSGEFKKKHRPLLDRCEQLNRDAYSLLYSVEVHTEDGREIIVERLFMRAVEFYQAAILLLEKGMQTSAKGNVRSLLESVFILRAVAKCDEMLKAYIKQDECKRLKLINKAQHNKTPNLELLQQENLDPIKNEINRTIEEEEIKRISTEEFSRRANMHDWYVDIYSSWLSPATHSSVRDLEKDLVLTEQGEMLGLRCGPEDSEAPSLLAHASHCLIMGFPAVANVFFNGNSEKLSGLKKLWDAHCDFFKSVVDELNRETPLDRP